MAQQSAYAFAPYSIVGTTQAAVGGAAGVTTVTLTGSVAGQLDAVRITNVGTASLFVGFASSSSTQTIGVTTGMPILSNSTSVFRVYGNNLVQLLTASTFTVTAYCTPGIGIN